MTIRRPAPFIGVAIACATFLAAGGTAQASVAPTWRITYHTSYRVASSWRGIVAPSRSEAWAVGFTYSGSTLLRYFLDRWNGSRWQEIPVPGVNLRPAQISASGPGNVWLFANGRRAFRWDGSIWQKVSIPQGVSTGGAVVLSPSDVWTTGGGSCTAPYIFHFNGATWTKMISPVRLDDMAGSSPRNFWILGTPAAAGCRLPKADLMAYHWDGHSFTRVPIPAISGEHYGTIATDSSHDVWISPLGRAAIAHWNGARWTVIHDAPASAIGGQLVPDGHGGTWVGGCEHWTAGVWQEVNSAVDACGETWGIAHVPGTNSTWRLGIATFGDRAEGTIEVNGPQP